MIQAINPPKGREMGMEKQKKRSLKNEAIHQPFSQLSDETLVRLIQEKKDTPEALQLEEEMFRRYMGVIRSKAHHYFLMGGDRDDIIQEGMIGLYKAIRDYRPEHDTLFRSFADLCITRQMITAIKMATRKKHQPLNSYVSLDQPISPNDENERSLFDIFDLLAEESPEDQLLSNESLAAIQKQIQEILSPFEQEVLEQFVKGKQYQEIATTLGRTPKAIDNALQRIRKKLESRLIVDNYEEK